MARSERLTSTRDTLLASSRRQRFDLALGPPAIGHQIRGLETLFGVKLFIPWSLIGVGLDVWLRIGFEPMTFRL
jgi:hypothetical protein